MYPDSKQHVQEHSIKPEYNSSKSLHIDQIKNVLVILVGGTLASVYTPKGIVPCEPGEFVEVIKQYKVVNDDTFDTSSYNDHNRFTDTSKPIALEKRQGDNIRVLYSIYETHPLLDSSNMNQVDWIKIGCVVEKFYREYDGFVIVHGTDTMCYTSSALSFMCENLGKSIIITGSQIPLIEPDSDALNNLYGAVYLAGHYIIPEVSIYCSHKLYRGNRAVKLNCSNIDAFGTPNLQPLAVKGTKFRIEWDIIHRSTTLKEFELHKIMAQHVGILRIYPGISADVVRNFLLEPLKGAILLTFGTGNIPTIDKSLQEEIAMACKRGIVIVNITQCFSGMVETSYAVGKVLDDCGVVCGYDMTPEAALTKLIYLFGKGYSSTKIKGLMKYNLRGELTSFLFETDERKVSSSVLKKMAENLNYDTKEELLVLKNVLIPPILCSAARDGDINMIMENLQDLNSHKNINLVNIADYDGRTPLHIAVSEGHYDVVKYLLHQGANVHKTDRWNKNSLRCAIDYKCFDIIKLLRETGAHLIETEMDIAAQTCRAASVGDFNVLKAWSLSGATLKERDYNESSPLDVAMKCNQKSIVNYLQSL